MGPSYRNAAVGSQTKQQEPVDLEVRVLSPRGSLPGINNVHNAGGRRRRPHSGRVYEWITVGLLALCLVASFVRFNSNVKVFEAHHLEREPIDVVAVSLKPSCVTRQAVASLNRYLKPRAIHVITTNSDKCRLFSSFASNVVCHIEDEYLDGLSVDRIGKYIEQRLGVNQHKHFKGRELSGWYMQQFLKLGSALALPDLTDYYVVWDLDMVLLSPVQLLWHDGDLPGGEAHTRTLVNVGGSVSPGYMTSFQQLTRRTMEFAPDGSSFVTHWMVVYKPYLLEFLREVAGSDGPLDWVWRILASVEPTSADLGFSEYWSYISWVRQHYPQSQRLAERKTWVRHPFGQNTVKFLRFLRSDRCCCPTWWVLRLVRALGFVYTGYEVGHIEECRYDEPQHETAYGL